ncbi:hypothetical protein GF324_10200 [bacterium]|nr:hypothetical protein [bacterium]
MNRTLARTTSIFGTVLGLAGFNHGLFEVLQGNKPVEGVFIPAIGPSMQMWEHGSEGAFTLLPTYLSAGIATMLVSLIAIFWSIRCIHLRRGPLVFLLLFILLFLTGGGIGHVIIFTITWAFATRIHRPLPLWKKILPPAVRPVTAGLWPWITGLSVLLYLLALWIAVTGKVPGVMEDGQALIVMLVSILSALVLMVLSNIAAIARDLEPAPVG